MTVLHLALLLALTSTEPPPLPAVVEAALRPGPGARAEVLEVQGALPPRCPWTSAEVTQPVAASGRVAVRLLGAGPDCEAWAWARVRVRARVLVTTRAVDAGAPLAAAAELAEREILPGRGHLASLAEGAVAARALAAGTVLDEGAVRVGPPPGDPVWVVLRTGTLTLERAGQAVPCRRGRACALLPSGRRVEGAWHGGRIELETP